RRARNVRLMLFDLDHASIITRIAGKREAGKIKRRNRCPAQCDVGRLERDRAASARYGRYNVLLNCGPRRVETVEDRLRIAAKRGDGFREISKLGSGIRVR